MFGAKSRSCARRNDWASRANERQPWGRYLDPHRRGKKISGNEGSFLQMALKNRRLADPHAIIARRQNLNDYENHSADAVEGLSMEGVVPVNVGLPSS